MSITRECVECHQPMQPNTPCATFPCVLCTLRQRVIDAQAPYWSAEMAVDAAEESGATDAEMEPLREAARDAMIAADAPTAEAIRAKTDREMAVLGARLDMLIHCDDDMLRRLGLTMRGRK